MQNRFYRRLLRFALKGISNFTAENIQRLKRPKFGGFGLYQVAKASVANGVAGKVKFQKLADSVVTGQCQTLLRHD